MNNQQLAIATMSWARDEQEEELLRASLQQLSLLNVPVFVADGGSKTSFVNYLRGLPNIHMLQPTHTGLWSQVNVSLQHAYKSGATFILYTEPDKLDFFKQLPQMLNEVELSEGSGVMLAERSAAGFASFPAFQQMCETTINNCCAEAAGKQVDYTYGPFIMNKNIVPHLQELPTSIGWGWRPYAFNIAVRLGLSLEAYNRDFYCPLQQRDDDATERIYRMKQLTQNIEGIVLSTNFKPQ